ncbi:hypothetical protein Tco_1496924 [Tanacetum coccineum]
MRMVPYEAFKCRCGTGYVVLRESYKPKSRCKLYYASPRSKPREDYIGCGSFYGKRNESVYWSILLELHRLQVILQDLQHLQAILHDLQHLKAIPQEHQEMQGAQIASTCLER